MATKHSGIPLNADLVAWTDEPKVLRHGGHLPLGWKFVLPYEPTGERGQPEWRYGGKCGALFFDGYDNFKGVCPTDGTHVAVGWNFLLPFEPTGVPGQPDWRYCGKCAGLFWNGGAHKGICRGAPGGGFHLNAVLRCDGWFDPFTATAPVGQTLSLETPNGAFSYAGKVWVFAGFSDAKYSQHMRPGDPAPGCYLTSKERPDQAGPDQTEFHFSPRIGWCLHDANRDRLENHTPLGYKFLLSHDIPEGPNRQAHYRFCRKCTTLFWDGDGEATSRCHRGGRHEADGLKYVLLHSVAEDVQNQANWQHCVKCASGFWNGDNTNGLCPAGDEHQPSPHNLLLTHPSLEEEATHQANWRYCGKCFALFFEGYAEKGVCPKDRAGHSAIGFNFVLPPNPGEDVLTQGGGRFCTKCHGVVWTGQEDTFTWVAPWVVRTADHPGLPQTPHELGLVLFGLGYASTPGIRLAWMPLKSPAAPMLQDMLYYTGQQTALWSPNAADAVVILPHTNTYSHLSAAWLDGAQCWILLYSNANDESGPAGYHLSAVARIGTSLWDWSDEVEIFNPITQGADDRSMHRVGGRPINPDIPPPQDPTKPEHDGWAYGALLLNRYTEWDASTRELGIDYLLSLSSPYQVQLMQTRLRLGGSGTS